MRKRNLKRKSSQSGGRRNEKGMQLVEMAFIMPIMMILLGALVELSYYFYTYATLARATRAGAGYIYTKAYIDTEITKAKNMVVCGELNTCSGFSSIVPNLSAANVTVALDSTVPNDKTITVKIVNYSYTPLFNLTSMTKSYGKTVNGVQEGVKWDTTVTKINAATTMRYTGDR